MGHFWLPTRLPDDGALPSARRPISRNGRPRALPCTPCSHLQALPNTPRHHERSHADLGLRVGQSRSDQCTKDRATSTLSARLPDASDRKSTRLNSSHANISYAVFCLKKKTTFAYCTIKPKYDYWTVD